MAPKRPAAAGAPPGSGSDASDREAGDVRYTRRRRRNSPSPVRSPSRFRSRSRSPSRSRSKTPPPNLRPNAAALSSTPTSAGADFAAASDSDAGGRASPPRRGDRKGPPRDRLDSDADADARSGGRAPSPRRRGERSPSFHSDSDADAAGRVRSPRRNRERTPRLRSDSDSDNSLAPAGSEDEGAGDASPLPRARRSSRIETSNIKPVSTRPMEVPRRASAGSSRRSSKRRHSSPEQQKRPPRVWSPEDEITILFALIDYRAKKGRLPASIQDTGKVHSQISGQLTANASTTQLSDKIRRLKHKYKLLVTRAKNGRDPDLPTEHERDVYELSKRVWGFTSGGALGGSRAYEDAGDAESNEEQEIEESDEDMENGWEGHEHTSKKPKASRFENGNGNALAVVGRASHGNGSGRDDTEKGKQTYPYLWEAVEELSKEHPSGPVFRKAFGVLQKSKARAMEEKLRTFRMSEIRQQLRRMDLMKETVEMVLDALDGAY
ncbi:GLABROUS1 enhancer-binding protein-like [Panicum virgatum]|uniref:Glabrous enhancer-binding protein-like DBD domain-containing protein n=1 Tax=Panicum virgatum TaxID=38727 RepID=A0A8T0R172_PANVG|nr:GLABROUS1 enhancer-binding protein-like [Panicum virgatum]KAG2579290.1 hypothetical protein PVAP13_6NG244600 [Panicum virgatum]KAG2579291.1 hypothetical protein PVAP13_6NG244600 [Panicum virgatum]